MDYRAFEQRLLDTIFTTDAQLTPATIAYLYKLSVQEAADLLQQAAVQGLLNIESDDEGNLLYTYPNRQKLQRQGGPPVPPQERGEAALVRGDQRVLLRPEPQATEPIHLAAEPLDKDHGGRCPFCNEPIVVGAKKCKHCHEYLDYALRDIHAARHPIPSGTPIVALQPVVQQIQPQSQQQLVWSGIQPALLSFFVPGLGQICTGRVPSGLLWMMFTLIGYFPLVVPGIILHILCIINATKQPRQGYSG